MPTKNRQIALWMILHNLDKDVAYGITSEMGEKLIVRNLPFVPARLLERWHMGQQQQIAKACNGRGQMGLEIVCRFIPERVQFGKAF